MSSQSPAGEARQEATALNRALARDGWARQRKGERKEEREREREGGRAFHDCHRQGVIQFSGRRTRGHSCFDCQARHKVASLLLLFAFLFFYLPLLISFFLFLCFVMFFSVLFFSLSSFLPFHLPPLFWIPYSFLPFFHPSSLPSFISFFFSFLSQTLFLRDCSLCCELLHARLNLSKGRERGEGRKKKKE